MDVVEDEFHMLRAHAPYAPKCVRYLVLFHNFGGVAQQWAILYTCLTVTTCHTLSIEVLLWVSALY